MRQVCHDARFLRFGEEGNQLIDTLRGNAVDGTDGRIQDMELIVHSVHDLVAVVREDHIVHDAGTGKRLHLLIGKHRADILFRDDAAINHLALTRDAIAAIQRDVAIDFQVAQVINPQYMPTAGNKHLHALRPQLMNGPDRRLGNHVRLETHQRAIDIKECCFYHSLNRLSYT